MSIYIDKIYHAILNFSLKILVKSRIIPINIENRICTENLYGKKKIIYVLPYTSKTDLFTLRIKCIKQGFQDPLLPIYIGKTTIQRYIFVHNKSYLPCWKHEVIYCLSLFHKYLSLYPLYSELDIQFILVSVIFSRSPNKKFQYYHTSKSKLQHLFKKIKKFFIILWFGRSSYIYFSQPLSLQHILVRYKYDNYIILKLIRTACIYFIRQRLTSIGPIQKNYKNLPVTILNVNSIKKIIENEAKRKNVPIKVIQKYAMKFIKEISSNFSYTSIRLLDRILRWIYNRWYQGLYVHNINRIYNLSRQGYEIIYVPCHKSHMDYFVLSYTLHYHGIVPPHIAAGINLNFHLIGPIFRKLGAFFIRRAFQHNKLYFIIFREYIAKLIIYGYPIAYFIEGKRSRTGTLLNPKTGMLSMIIQSLFYKKNRPIALIPVYIDYEHVIEENTYLKEVYNLKIIKHTFRHVLFRFFSLQKLGNIYINFGKPVLLNSWLSHQVPCWYNSIDFNKIQRPNWLPPIANNISHAIMININNSVIVNATNLCAIVLLAANQFTLAKSIMLSQLSFYLSLLRNVPYSNETVVSYSSSREILMRATSLNKITIINNKFEKTVCCLKNQSILMNYYRNSIQHLFVLPSLVANIIYKYNEVEYKKLCQEIFLLYPLLKLGLFIHYNNEQLSSVISNIINEFIQHNLIEIKCTNKIYLIKNKLETMQLLSNSINIILYQYTIIFSLLYSSPFYKLSSLKKDSKFIMRKICELYKLNIIEFPDENKLVTILLTITKEYATDSIFFNEKVFRTYNSLKELIVSDVFCSIWDIIFSKKTNQR